MTSELVEVFQSVKQFWLSDIMLVSLTFSLIFLTKLYFWSNIEKSKCQNYVYNICAEWSID